MHRDDIKLILAIIIAGAAILAWAIFAPIPSAAAKIGIATGLGPHLSNPLTPHIGPVYYKPTARNSVAGDAAQAVDQAPTELEEFLGIAHRVRHAKAQAACDRHRVGYFYRHGITTPRPLKGFHGCQKYAMDAAYWRGYAADQLHQAKSDVSVSNVAEAATLQVEISLHNIVLPWH